jgi:hypothetical protein
MKIIATLLLFVIVSFLITPTIVRLIEKEAAISTNYNFSEDEKVQNEIIAIISLDVVSTTANLFQLKYRFNFSEYLSHQNSISSKIFITPPDHV